MANSALDRSIADRTKPGRAALLSRLGPAVLFYCLALTGAELVRAGSGVTDSVAAENDNAMRMVEVRDFLAGQSWFDLTQYRLGLADGVLMHWSRLIDLPIASLIRFFGLFLENAQAEAAAVTTWPILLSAVLLWPLGFAARRVAGPAVAAPVMHIALGLGAIFIFTCGRFAPGAIDHHNAQLALAMWIAAMLADPDKRPASYVIAGFASAVAIAIGAEMVPYVAIACAVVALQWVWHGNIFALPARVFGLSLALSISALFVLTVPPRDYAVVTCDSLSLGFYALSALGGAALALLTVLPKTSSRLVRIMFAAATGGFLLLAARIIAPQCLGNPLGSLDPMLVRLWLNSVTEAQPVLKQAIIAPESLGGLYAVGLFAMIVCLFRSIRREKTELHLVLLALIGVSWGVALLQVRGAVFANLLSILPLSLLIGDIRKSVNERPNDKKLALGYVAVVILSVPAVWAVAGFAIVKGPSALGNFDSDSGSGAASESKECSSPADMAALGALEAGTVVAPSNSGADILRDTSHRVLSAPYHRNQKGMLTELRIGQASPAEAKALLKGANVSILAFCETDPQTSSLIELKPDGLYANLARGMVPDYLDPVGGETKDGQGFRLYYVRAD